MLPLRFHLCMSTYHVLNFSGCFLFSRMSCLGSSRNSPSGSFPLNRCLSGPLSGTCAANFLHSTDVRLLFLLSSIHARLLYLDPHCGSSSPFSAPCALFSFTVTDPRGFGSVCIPFTSSSLYNSVVSGAQMSLVNVPFFDTLYGLRPTSYPRPPYLDMASMASFSSPSATNLLRVSTGIAYRFSLASDLCSISLGFCFGSSPSLSC